MGRGRGLLAGVGWAGTIGVIALCVLVLLFALVAFSGQRRGDVTKLPSVREGRVALPPPGRGAPSPAPARPTPSGPGGSGGGLSP